MKVSLQLIPEQPAEELVAAAQAADELGFYACYSADEIYHKDAWLLLGAVAGRTERIRLGPCVGPGVPAGSVPYRSTCGHARRAERRPRRSPLGYGKPGHARAVRSRVARQPPDRAA